ncbi:hypothetical protein B0H12DRAFT_1210112 [Mycena haematopus]|nr:hypothetical protein B0H12DRAFT_1210112 [Mycena haematopus]
MQPWPNSPILALSCPLPYLPDMKKAQREGDKRTEWDLRGPFATYPRVEQWEPGWAPKMLAELRIYQLSWQLRRKLDWQCKASNPSIRAKWRREVLGQQKGIKLDKQMTEKMVDYVLAELEGYANIADNERGIERGCYDAIWYSDRMVPDDLNERLKAAVSVLENIPEVEKDWHPGSNVQVLDLVHPSLYCIVYGRSSGYLSDQIRSPENLRPVAVPPFNENAGEWDPNLIYPYINNLCPTKHQPLYHIIEEVLTGFIPMFDRVLGDIDRKNPLNTDSRRLKWTYCIWGDAGEDNRPDYASHVDDLRAKGKHCYETEEYWYDSQKDLPEARVYKGQLERTLSPITLRGRTIQYIIKLANIHLTPEKPEYAVGSWHSFKYYDHENVTESKLAFRVSTSEPDHHSHNDHECAMTQYGLSTYDKCVQDIGAMRTKEGRTLAWPNDFQHRVSSFELADPFSRSTMADRIPSTTDVPPQQAEWACEVLQELRGDGGSRMASLSQELVHMIKEEIRDVGMSFGEAEEYRLELMKERTAFVKDHSNVAYGVKFNLCEH